MTDGAPPSGAEWALGGETGRLEAVAARVARLVEASAARDTPAPAIGPDELASRIAALEVLPEVGVGVDRALEELAEHVLPYAVHPWHPHCVAHLHAPTLLAAAAAELPIGAVNASLDSYDQAPGATLVEDHLVRALGALLGLPETRSGVLTAGGTASNLLGLTLARARAYPDAAQHGLPTRRGRIVTSAAAHDSVRRAASLLGLGAQSVLALSVDRRGALDPKALDCIDGEVAAFVATAGTTDHGAIDPLNAIADAAQRHDAWLHVDAAVGAALALSDELKPRLAGIERADSITVDLHKLWWLPIGASALLVADEHRFDALGHESDYLNRPEDGVLNLVGRSLDTSRRFDALKALVALRATGRSEYARLLEHCVELARQVAQRIDEHARLELVANPSTVMVLFRVADTDNAALQQRLFEQGSAVLGRTLVDGRPTLKLTLMNPRTTLADLEALLDLVVRSA